MQKPLSLSEAKKSLSPEEYAQYLEQEGMSETMANFTLAIEAGKIGGDYVVIEIDENELTSLNDNAFKTYIRKRKLDESGRDIVTRARNRAIILKIRKLFHSISETTRQQIHLPVHMLIGDWLTKFGVILLGNHLETHGSDWLGEPSALDAVRAALPELGLMPTKKKDIFKYGPIQVDLGIDEYNLYIFISDANGMDDFDLWKLEKAERTTDGNTPDGQVDQDSQLVSLPDDLSPTPIARASHYWAQVVNSKAYLTGEVIQPYRGILPFMMDPSLTAQQLWDFILEADNIQHADKQPIIRQIRKAMAEVAAAYWQKMHPSDEKHPRKIVDSDPNLNLPLHIQVGLRLEKYSVIPSGKHLEEHGSAYEGPAAAYEALCRALPEMGYLPSRKKGIFRGGTVKIDTQQAAGKVYVYITDDNQSPAAHSPRRQETTNPT